MGEEVKQAEKQEAKTPSPCVLFVELHCVGCAKKIKKCIMKMRGVEEVVIDMANYEVTIKGIVKPQAICDMVTKKTRRRANVISPLPTAEGETIPEVVASQVSGLVTVELNVNMHCEPCAEQLKRKILKMRGVQTAVTELSTGKVTVTGTMNADKLVDYVYRRTKKQAKIVPQPQPEQEKEENKEAEKPAAQEGKPAEEPKKEEEKPAEEPKKEEEKPEEEPKKEEEKPAEEFKKEEEKPAEEHKKEEEKPVEEEPKKEEKNPAEEEEPKKEEDGEEKNDHKEGKGGEGAEAKEGESDQHEVALNVDDEEGMKRMMYYYQPLYVIERIPPPQLFSDENPNACCIS